MRWALELQEYDFKIKYIPGHENAADFISRPINLCNTVTKHRGPKWIEDKEVQKKILAEYHLLSGHGSAKSLYFLIKNKYTWKGITTDTKNLVTECGICLRKGEQRRYTENKVIKSDYPNHIWEIDLIGKLNTEDGRGKYILTAIDHFSKYLETKVLATKEANEVLAAIDQVIIHRHGIPKTIYTDNGLEFANLQMKKYAEAHGIELKFCSPNYHKSVGCIERVNQTFLNKLRALNNFGPHGWEEKVQRATKAVNISYHRGLGTSPYILQKGFEPVAQIDIALNQPKTYIAKDLAFDVREMTHANYAEKDIKKGTRKLKDVYNKNEKVLVYSKLKKNKMETGWKGGYIIEGRASEGSYWVIKGNRKYRVNESHLKKDSLAERGMSYHDDHCSLSAHFSTPSHDARRSK